MPMKELMIMEQALKGMPEGIAIWLRERQPKSLKELAKLTEDYTLARTDKDLHHQNAKKTVDLLKMSGVQSSATNGNSPFARNRGYHPDTRTKVNAAGLKQCFHCHQWGHLKFNCTLLRTSSRKSNV